MNEQQEPPHPQQQAIDDALIRPEVIAEIERLACIAGVTIEIAADQVRAVLVEAAAPIAFLPAIIDTSFIEQQKRFSESLATLQQKMSQAMAEILKEEQGGSYAGFRAAYPETSTTTLPATPKPFRNSSNRPRFPRPTSARKPFRRGR